ncbi:uncharacterized protein LOC143604670 [Bidens hawaiensis]|uniref:uncharacterized protein LOC143604670 n=1 Tax=Bidens hawaiensis TaxID=980011 RepID=UPI004049BA96
MPDTKNTTGGNVAPSNTRERVFTLTTAEAASAPGTISGTLQLGERDIYVLFDTGATHSIISNLFTKHLLVEPSPLEYTLSISTPMGSSIIISHIYRDCHIHIDSIERKADLLPMQMGDFDVILGMDWLSRHRVTIDCHLRRVFFGDSHHPDLVYQRFQPHKSLKIISALKAQKLISHGCAGFLASVKDTTAGEVRIDSYHVVREYPDVFPDELPGLPPDHEIEFTIDLVPGAEPISKAP